MKTVTRIETEERKRHVLVVDDEMINRLLLGHILQNEFEIHYAADGEQALAFSRNRKANENYCPEKYTHVYRSVELSGQNQQTVILACLEKLKKLDITNIYITIITDVRYLLHLRRQFPLRTFMKICTEL